MDCVAGTGAMWNWKKNIAIKSLSRKMKARVMRRSWLKS